jgi:murein L,D-transpeptidase YcbB/YkuD
MPGIRFSNRLVRCSLVVALLPACVLAAAPLSAHSAAPRPVQAIAAPAAPTLQAVVVEKATGDLRAFYVHQSRLLWVAPDGTLDPAADALLQLVRTADYDGLDRAELGADQLALAIEDARIDRSPMALARAELMLSTVFSRYVEALLHEANRTDMQYEHDVLRPVEPTTLTALREAAAAPSLAPYVAGMHWLHPLYGQLRQQLLSAPPGQDGRAAAIASLRDIRAIPVPYWRRHVVVDTASARLWMYEGDRPVDSMRVVVGKPDTQTPMMAGYIRYAVVNPYWNVPANLVRKTIAPAVLSQGVRYLRARGYEVLSSWDADATLLDPSKIDWRAVKNGEVELRVRQRPGAANAMGAVKFEFPNPLGIYLHHTPDKQLMLEDARQFSNGCVRLEDAARFERWLFGGALPRVDEGPEQQVDLAQPVPVYITYLPVRPEAGGLAVGPDPYGRVDAVPAALARLD